LTDEVKPESEIDASLNVTGLMQQVKKGIVVQTVLMLLITFATFFWLLYSAIASLNNFVMISGFFAVLIVGIAIVGEIKNRFGRELFGTRWFDLYIRKEGEKVDKSLKLSDQQVNSGEVEPKELGPYNDYYGYGLEFDDDEIPNCVLISPVEFSEAFDFSKGAVPYKNLILQAETTRVDVALKGFCDIGDTGEQYLTPVFEVLASDYHGKNAILSIGKSMEDVRISNDIDFSDYDAMGEFVERFDAQKAKKAMQELEMYKNQVETLRDMLERAKALGGEAVVELLDEETKMNEVSQIDEVSIVDKVAPTTKRKILLAASIAGIAGAITYFLLGGIL